MGGIFGRRPAGFLRRADGDPGTFVNYLLFGLGGVEQMRDRRNQDELLRARMSEHKLEMSREMQQREAFEQALSQLPPEQQIWARMNPEAFAEAMLEAQGGGGWQHGQGYSHLWRPNPDGSVTLGDALPLRPRAGPRAQMGAPPLPDGFDWE